MLRSSPTRASARHARVATTRVRIVVHTALVLVAACGGATRDTRDPVAPAFNPLATLPGTYGLRSVDGQLLPVAVSQTDTLVADTVYLSGRVDSSVTRTRVERWFVSGGMYAGPGGATLHDYEGGWRVRGGKPFVWATGADSVPISVPDVATVAFARYGHLYLYKR